MVPPYTMRVYYYWTQRFVRGTDLSRRRVGFFSHGPRKGFIARLQPLRSLPHRTVIAGIGAAALACALPSDSAQRVRNTVQMGMLVLHGSDTTTMLRMAAHWSQLLCCGGLEVELVERLLDGILCLQDDEQDHETLRVLTTRGTVALLLRYTACHKPRDPTRLQQILQSLIKLLEASQRSHQATMTLPLVTLAQTLEHFVEQQDKVVSFDTLLAQLGNALLRGNHQLGWFGIHDEDDSAAWNLRVYPSELMDRHASHIPDCCAALVNLCSPQLPESIKRVALHALEVLVRTVERHESSGSQAQQLKAALNPTLALNMLALPRDSSGISMQLQATTVLDLLLHIARRHPAAVARDTYELWMELIQYWAKIEPSDKESPKTSTHFWIPRKLDSCDHHKSQKTQRGSSRLDDQQLLLSARCLRTLTAFPLGRRYVSESLPTRTAFFQLSRQIFDEKQRYGSFGKEREEERWSLERNLSWTFRNLCTGFQSGATALTCLFGASWTAQSRRDLPMSRVFRGTNDLTDLPILGAEEYEAATEVGWIDMLTAWSASPDHQVRKNAIASLVFLAEMHQSCRSYLMVDEETRTMQKHILQAWLTTMLQQIRVVSGSELLAVKQMEAIAHVSNELTPGNECILFNPAVVDAGTSALAVLAEHHHAQLMQQGVVRLVALLAGIDGTTSAQQTQCARVLANLVASYCLDMASRNSMNLSVDATSAFFLKDHVNIAELLKQTVSGKHLLRALGRWRECENPMQRSNYYRVLQNLYAYEQVVATGRLMEDVYCDGVNPIVSHQDVEHPTDSDSHAPVVDVVFVHGLRGHPFGTWRTQMKKSDDIWPDVLLATDLQRYNIRARLVTLGYEAGMVSWSSPWPSLTLQERARVMLSALYAANIGCDRRLSDSPCTRPVVFVTHSMGGLLTKKMLLLDREERSQSAIADSTAGVIFLAVPHFGSDLANGVRSESIRNLIQMHPAIEDLGSDFNGRLKSLNESFQQLHIDCFSVGEDHASPIALGLSAVVVKPESANPGIGCFYVLPESNHMTICKIKSRDEPLYQDILRYIVQRVTKKSVNCLTEGSAFNGSSDD
ncbi:hypothetical protein PsorP6_011147 [Peronosclerospora sorghi]|uniref:Uncharacterized protein n=1 Tax=Peronosclerospora sorghi TaxID=230839 RepID=A0ACC0VY33_9STRA|nr:hypothetical protein PsorP6_011147 [Peronosclerospora sorghi]